jgi:hypothetical protein
LQVAAGLFYELDLVAPVWACPAANSQSERSAEDHDGPQRADKVAKRFFVAACAAAHRAGAAVLIDESPLRL